tara:strand:- start:239 stop:1426 length:1188 start_codon:yes stop_codon:yes gene_type:complete
MNSVEWRAVLCLGVIYALRMVGMFMILPVFALYARELPGGATPLAIGLAIGIYGLAQAGLQIPLGLLSDRIGRKPVIYLGMTIFALGSLVAGLADSIEGIIVGRVLQGAGAVSSAVAALLADVTRDQVRTTAMAILGAGMGLAFIIALVAGPIMAGWIGVDGIFFLTAVLAMLTLPIVRLGVPTPELSTPQVGGFRIAMRDPDLLRLNAGIFLLHALMTALFTSAPIAIFETLDLVSTEHWRVYLPILVLSIIPIFPLIRWAERSGRTRGVFRCAVIGLAGAMLIAAMGHGVALALLAALLLFFVAFNYLEGALPSMISRRAPSSARGAALGAYASSQFLGAFAGGALGGTAQMLWGLTGAFAVCAALPIIWLLIPPAAAPTSEVEASAASTPST